MKFKKLSAAYSYAKKNGSLSTHMIANNVKDILPMIPLLAALPVQILKNIDKNVAASPDHIDWEEEREDILERANPAPCWYMRWQTSVLSIPTRRMLVQD